MGDSFPIHFLFNSQSFPIHFQGSGNKVKFLTQKGNAKVKNKLVNSQLINQYINIGSQFLVLQFLVFLVLQFSSFLVFSITSSQFCQYSSSQFCQYSSSQFCQYSSFLVFSTSFLVFSTLVFYLSLPQLTLVLGKKRPQKGIPQYGRPSFLLLGTPS